MIPSSSLGWTSEAGCSSNSRAKFTYGSLCSFLLTLLTLIWQTLSYWSLRPTPPPSPPQEVYSHVTLLQILGFSFFAKCTWVTFRCFFLTSRVCNQVRNPPSVIQGRCFHTSGLLVHLKRNPSSFSCTPRCGSFPPVWRHPSHVGAYQNTRTRNSRKHLVPSPPSEQQMPRNVPFFRPKYKIDLEFYVVGKLCISVWLFFFCFLVKT